MSFAEDLKTLRVVRGLTQAQLADKASTLQAVVSRIETGKKLATPELEKRLREALNWTALEDEAFAILGQEPA